MDGEDGSGPTSMLLQAVLCGFCVCKGKEHMKQEGEKGWTEGEIRGERVDGMCVLSV